MASMRQNIARALIKTRIGLTPREIGEDLQMKPAVISIDLSKMAIEGLAIKGEYLEGGGQLWTITEKGVETYATKEDLEVKPPVEISQAKPKNKPLSEIKSVKMPVEVKTNVQPVEPVAVENAATEIDDFETRFPFSGVEIDEFETPKTAKLSTDNFAVWKIVDDAGSKFIELLADLKPKQIENIDYKIATLESLADIYNPKISATLREIALDLRG